ncbi:cell division protein ZapE [Gordonia bronchialis]|nr:cell division protein ZapE [Gordonia bronchialis]
MATAYLNSRMIELIVGLFRNRSLRVSPRVFDDAALTAGIELDDSQRVAVTALCSPDGWVYLTGPAGRGKSWLMDVYTGGLPADAVARLTGIPTSATCTGPSIHSAA